MSCILTSLFFQDIIEKILFPVFVGTLTYLLFRSLDEWKKRKSQSKLGVIIINSLIEEVQRGIALMKDFQNNNVKPSYLLPYKSWNGMSTISDDILLRIIGVSANVIPESFPPTEIRTHCKNYFDHMTTSWENSLKDSTNWKASINSLINHGKYIEAASNVVKMLEQCRNLLSENSKKFFPQ